MGITNASNTVAFKSAAAIGKYLAVYQSSGAVVSLLSSGATHGVGFTQNATTAADQVQEVAFEEGRETYAVSGSTGITINAELMVSTSGVVIAATTGLVVSAIARETSSAVGDIIRVQITDYVKP